MSQPNFISVISRSFGKTVNFNNSLNLLGEGLFRLIIYFGLTDYPALWSVVNLPSFILLHMPKNILLITADEMRADCFGAAGNPDVI